MQISTIQLTNWKKFIKIAQMGVKRISYSQTLHCFHVTEIMEVMKIEVEVFWNVEWRTYWPNKDFQHKKKSGESSDHSQDWRGPDQKGYTLDMCAMSYHRPFESLLYAQCLGIQQGPPVENQEYENEVTMMLQRSGVHFSCKQ